MLTVVSTAAAQYATARLPLLPGDYTVEARRLQALRISGTLCMLGLPDRYEPEPMALLGRKDLTISGSGGPGRTREMLEFCAQHQITAEVEVLPLAEVGTALERLRRNDVRYRFVLDVAGH